MRQDLWVLHLDMDAFFASVEQRDNPRLRGRPVVVGGPPRSRGVVSTCSYEARAFGVRSAMPSREAHRLCPTAIFIPPNMQKYGAISRQIRAIMARYTDKIEPLSVDEAFLDVTGQDAIRVGRAIKQAIQDELHLTASVGVAYCKFLAKMASDWEKPNGFTVFTPERAQEILPGLTLRKLWGVGPATEAHLNKHGLQSCGDLLQADPDWLRKVLGRRGDELRLLAQGIDHRPVVTSHESKSIGTERTFQIDQGDPSVLRRLLGEYAEELAQDLAKQEMLCRTVTIKIKWNVFQSGGPKGGDFLAITRSQTLAQPTKDPAQIARAALDLLAKVEWEGRKVRLLGLSVGNFVHRGDQFQSYLSV
ncbi:MAG TPA: DNA polymerase IV [Symbiobacteriaceae bacterium]|nr:DNA polymerase IV [Symbiobacteriaceae bacterium]